MKAYFLALIFIFSSFIGFSQAFVDSIISKFRTDNPVIFDQQLYMLEDHGRLKKIDPNPEAWPALSLVIAEKVVFKARTLRSPAKVMALAHQAEVITRCMQGARGYTLVNEARHLAEKLEGQPRIYAYMKYSEILRLLNRYDSAVFYAEKALDIANEIKSDSLQKRALEQVAGLCYSTRNNTKAELYFKKLALSPTADDVAKRSYFNTIGLTFRRREMFDSAIHYFRKSLLHVDRTDTAWIGLLNGNIGYIYYLQKDYKRALPGLLLDVDYSFRSHSYASGLGALNSVASIYILTKDIKHADYYYDSLRREIQRRRDPEMVVDFYRISADYFKAKGDLKKTVQYLEAFISLSDSILNIQNLEHGRELDSRFEFERQVKQIETLEMQSQLQVEENQKKNYFLIGTSVFIVLASGLVYVLYRSVRFKNFTNNLLHERNKQISDQAIRLNELNITKDKLFSIISHDLRGPINSLRGLLDMVRRKIVTQDEFAHLSEQLQTNVEHVQFTLDNLLQWSGSQLQGIQTNPELFDLHLLVTENFNLVREPANSKNIKLINEIQKGVTILADKNQIRLVLRNLIGNAIKFTGSGGTIAISSREEANKEIISVTDTGTGMSAVMKTKLFQAASHQSVTGTDGEKGTGLGLAICKEMLEMNGGKIWVESEIGQGTSFIFSLPKIYSQLSNQSE